MPVFMTETGEEAGTSGGFRNQWNNIGSTVSEIEEDNSSELFEIKDGTAMAPIREEFEGSLFSVDIQNGVDMVYVGVGKSDSSVDALAWTLKHAVTPSTLVYLIHVFPEIRYIPSPLGKLPRSQVSRQQVENHMIQERSKSRELLQKFLDMCSASKVKVDTILIESDMVAKAVLDLIPILNIRKLVLGTTKSTLRKLKSRRGSGIADQVLQNAPDSCEIKIICEGKEVFDQMIETPSPRGTDATCKSPEGDHQRNNSISCNCFKPKFI